jgi:hypothetical protein
MHGGSFFSSRGVSTGLAVDLFALGYIGDVRLAVSARGCTKPGVAPDPRRALRPRGVPDPKAVSPICYPSRAVAEGVWRQGEPPGLPRRV